MGMREGKIRSPASLGQWQHQWPEITQFAFLYFVPFVLPPQYFKTTLGALGERSYLNAIGCGSCSSLWLKIDTHTYIRSALSRHRSGLSRSVWFFGGGGGPGNFPGKTCNLLLNWNKEQYTENPTAIHLSFCFRNMITPAKETILRNLPHYINVALILWSIT